MNRLFLAIACFCCAVCASARYVVVDDTLRASRCYPNTVHALRVTVPRDLPPGARVGLYLGLDGVLCNAPFVLDSLAAEGVVPPMVGVYLQPGVVYGSDGKVVRFNRSNEFDAIDATFSDFLKHEILPLVDSIVSLKGGGITVTDDPADRMIFGLSSGGIAAFTAAWHRPEMFGKVFTGCGTYVPMRGGHNLQAVVRKHEPRPLRIFMQDGTRDAWNPLFGSWYEANRLLASALEFAGYDCAFHWDDSGHSVAPSARIFPDVIKWMWRDGSRALTPGKSQNNMLSALLVDGERWTAVADSAIRPVSCRSEAVRPDSALVACVRPGSNFLWQYLIDSDGSRHAGQRFYWLHDYDNSQLTVADLAFDGDGNLWVFTDAGLQICDQNGRVRAILDLPFAPDGFEPAEIIIADGLVTLRAAERAFTRRLNVRAPRPGVTPESQGPA